MKIIEIRVQVTDKEEITELALQDLAESLKNYIYGFEESAIQDVTYEILDSYQE